MKVLLPFHYLKISLVYSQLRIQMKRQINRKGPDLPFLSTQRKFCFLTVVILFHGDLHCSKDTFHGTVNKVKASHQLMLY